MCDRSAGAPRPSAMSGLPSSPRIASSEGGSGQNAVVLLDRPIGWWDASALEREPRGNEKREYEIWDQFTSRG
jgi:hypothetical protein